MATSVEAAPSQLRSFVGRERELAFLSERLLRAREGYGDLVLVRSEAGLGKTRLCQELREVARVGGFVCLEGHCLEPSIAIPYAPFAEVLESATAAFGEDAFREIAADSGPQLALIAPALRGSLPDPAAGQALDQERHALFGAMRDFLDRASRITPLLLIIEDVHWTDEATILLLRYLVRFTSSHRILIVATCRPTDGNEADQGASTTQLSGDLERSGEGGVLLLDELVLVDVATMIATMVGREPPASICEALFNRTGGNPLFVEQVIKHLLDEGRLFDERDRWIELTSLDDLPIPGSVRSLIEHRMTRVDADCHGVVTAAAVAGRGVDYDLLSEVAGLSPSDFLTAVESGERAQLIVVEPNGGGLSITFRHDLIRKAILGNTSLPRRRALHLAFARTIERTCDVASGEHDPDLAHHYLQARSRENVDKTLRYLEGAGKRALRATAFEEAARLYAEALDLVPAAGRCEMLLLLGEARKRVSDSDLARSAFDEAASIARETGDAQQFARAALGYARSWPRVGSVDLQAVSLLQEALDLVPKEDLALRARLMSRHALQMLYSGSPESVLRLAREATDASRRSGDLVTLARALQVLHVALWQPEYLHERLAIATEIIELSAQIGDPSVALWGIRPRIADLMELGDIPAAEADIDAYERGATAARLPIYLWQAAVRKAMIAIFHGHLDEGERLAQRALELGRQAEGQNLIAAFGGQLLMVRWQQERTGELKRLIEASRKNEPGVALWAAVLAFIESESGRRAEARAEFEELATDRFESLTREDSGLVVLVLASLVCTALGDGIRAEQLYRLLLPYEGRNIVVSEGVAAVGAASQYLGMLAATARRLDDAERHLRDAIELNTRTGARPWLAQSQYELARVLLLRRRPGDRKASGELLRTALGIARDGGLRGLQDKVERVLRSHRRLTPERLDGLTSREQEVLVLVARGKSTREISEELVLSARTTARHITNIYAKVSARNRVEATSYALRHGLVDS